MIYPIALILGGDKKPVKVRVWCAERDSIEDRWLIDTEFDLVTNALQSYITHKNGEWAFDTYEWLPVLDIKGNLLRDGIIVVETYCPEKGIYELMAGHDLEIPFTLLDAFGRHRLISAKELFRYAKSIPKRLFCTLNYEKIKQSDTFTPESVAIDYNRVRYVIKDSQVSSDIASLCCDMQMDVKLLSGRIEINNMLNAGEQVIIPESWRSVTVAFSAISNTRELSFPDEMDYLDLNVSGSRLKSIALPRVVKCRRSGASGFMIYLLGAQEIEELIVPDELIGGEHNITLVGCGSLRVVRQRDGAHSFSKSIKLYIEDCPRLEIVDTPYYKYNSMTTLPKHIKIISG